MADAGAQGGHRRSGASRAIDLALRTGHLGAMATLTGGVAFDTPAASLRPWLLATVATGTGLLVSEASHSRHWIYQGRGLFVVAHLAALALLSRPHVTGTAAAAALVIGAVGSHLPRSVRKWSLRHGRVLD